MKHRARFIMIGGFLGAGKTTVLGALGRHFNKHGKRVGLITNDQADNLVDTLNLRSQGFSVEEIAGGCFCCRFNSLTDAAEKLSENERPDILLGEPVGSCTDLLATVAIPMKQLYGEQFDVAPLTVLVDPRRAQKILNNQQRGGFSPKVAYIYKKQLEEADAVAINKADIVDETELSDLKALIEEQFPGKKIFTFSARELTGLDPWFEFVANESMDWEKTMDVDYDIYADGEAELGWLNNSFKVSSDADFDPNRLLTAIAEEVQSKMQEADEEIAHLKATLISGMDIGFISLVRNDAIPELSQAVDSKVSDAEVTVNARAHVDPTRLRATVETAIANACQSQNLQFKMLSSQAFKPGRPVPVHRVSQG